MTSIHSRFSTTPRSETFWQRLKDKISGQLNFYRIHLLFFTFTPLIFSGIFYGCNGRYKISYADSLFNCVSAMTVCGLATINLSSVTPFQQVLLFILMCLGNPVIVSWVIVYMRRRYFAQKFEAFLQASVEKKIKKDIEQAPPTVPLVQKPWHHRLVAFVTGSQIRVVDEGKSPARQSSPKGKGGVFRKLRPDMIRRMDDAPKLINPSGWVSEGQAPSPPKTPSGPHPSPQPFTSDSSDASGGSSGSAYPEIPMQELSLPEAEDGEKKRRRLSDPGQISRAATPTTPSSSTKMHRFDTIAAPKPQVTAPKNFPHHQTIEFAPDPERRRDKLGSMAMPQHDEEEYMSHEMFSRNTVPPEMRRGRNLYSAQSIPMSTHTTRTHISRHTIHPVDAISSEFGGFPSPFAIIKALFARLFPRAQRQLTRALTMPATISLTPAQVGEVIEGRKHVPYISFDAVVGRNSAFQLLTKDQLEEIGGVEYRALNALLWIVGTYHIMIQLLSFTIVAPYISTQRWQSVFDEQIRPLNTVWFSAFQVVSAYTNTGISLVDQSMVPFEKAFPMVYVVMFLILAGNTCFPIFLRFMIWCISKMVHQTSRLHETLHFLLDHPRRCFLYLFPSHQTWFLFWVVLGLTCTDFFFFMVLDLKNYPIDAIPIGLRISDGWMQAVAVRSGGFSIVPLAAAAPAVKVLFVIMMYISVYPIAMSVRSTNVYEEQSLGIFAPHEHDGASDGASVNDIDSTERTTWSRYLSMHARKQLAFDIWWMALSLFVICIIEKNNLENPLNYGWFNIFRVLFELVSAYGTVGLSLGIPDQNYSFCGAFHTLSKLVICLVMIRGRHRGLPVAIDRAIMLPFEFKDESEEVEEPINDELNEENNAPFTYSETLGSRYNSDLRQRMRRKSTTAEEGYNAPAGLSESPKPIDNESLKNSTAVQGP
ncbi:TrkH-domain-containing protein [Pholiota conissans]|uniref:Potassium transport protein n=1 Tax=Pholiota conissans TaxID=109636 RepID=A0A9P5ZHJ5_9AGAR|nr:TrkH-domain-containing protein [Pholiota conissans]